MMFVVRSLENHQPLHLNSARWIQPPDFFNSSSYLNLSQSGTLRWPPFPSTPKKQLKFREFFMLINNLAPHQKCTKTRIDMPKVTKKISSGSASFMCLYERWKRHFDYKFFSTTLLTTRHIRSRISIADFINMFNEGYGIIPDFRTYYAQ